MDAAAKENKIKPIKVKREHSVTPCAHVEQLLVETDTL